MQTYLLTAEPIENSVRSFNQIQVELVFPEYSKIDIFGVIHNNHIIMYYLSASASVVYLCNHIGHYSYRHSIS